MKFYGEFIDDLKIQPQATPRIVEEENLDKFLDAVRNKKSHKRKMVEIFYSLNSASGEVCYPGGIHSHHCPMKNMLESSFEKTGEWHRNSTGK